MNMERFFTWIPILSLVVSLHWLGAEANVCTSLNVKNGKDFFGQYCILFIDDAKNYKDANAYCQQQGGRLAGIRDKGYTDFYKKEFDSLGWSSALMGITRDDTYWRTAQDKIIHAQGCFKDSSTRAGLPNQVLAGETVNNEAECGAACFKKFPTTTLYGVTILDGGKAGCYCGNDIRKMTQTDGCTVSCKDNDNSNLCGNTDKFLVYYQNGALESINWGYNQPNNFQQSQYCAAMDTRMKEGDFGDENCLKEHNFICIAKLSSVDCKNDTQETDLYFKINGTYCAHIVYSKALSWFGAHTYCHSHGSQWELLNIDSTPAMLEIEKTVSQLKKDAGKKVYYWFGVTKHFWKGPDGGTTHEYFNWGWQQPTSDSKSCMWMAKDNDPKWVWFSADCNTKKNFVCELDKPTTTTSTTTTTTTAPTTTTTTTTTTAPTTTKKKKVPTATLR